MSNRFKKSFNKTLACILAFCFCVSASAEKNNALPSQKSMGATQSNLKNAFIRILKKNRVVAAAIADAKSFSGAKDCGFDFTKLEEPSQFEKGTAYDFKVTISCSSGGDSETGGSSGIIEVEGQWVNYGEGPQDINKLTLHFAG